MAGSIFKSLLKTVVTMDVGADEIKAVSTKVKGDRIYLDFAESIHTPINTLRNGEVIDTERLEGVMSYFLHDRFPDAKFINLTIQPTAAMTRELVLPLVGNDEIAELLHYEIENRFSVDLNNFYMEYKILEVFVAEDGSQKMRVFIVILPKEIVDAYYNVIKNIKCVPVALDINCNAVAKMFEKPLIINDEVAYSTEETVAILDLGKETVNMAIISQGKLRLSRLFSLPDFEIDITDTVDVKWISEIYRIMQYYINLDPENNNIDKVFIHGGKAEVPGIEPYLSDAFDLPVVKLQTLDSVSVGILVRNTDVLRYINAIGASIGHDTV